MKKPFMTLLSVLIFCLAGCETGNSKPINSSNMPIDTRYYKASAGKVEISCGDIKITPYDNFISSYEHTPDGWLSGDGIRFEFSPESMKTEQFQTLDYTDGVDVSITGNSNYSAYYVLYRDDFERLGELKMQTGETRLKLPAEAGTYIVDLVINWRAGSNPANETREYLFKARYAPPATNP